MYKPLFHKRDISKNAIKTKNCNLFNHLNFYLTDKSTEKTFSVFSLTSLIVFSKCKKTTECDDTVGTEAKLDKVRQVTLFWKAPQLAV